MMQKRKSARKSRHQWRNMQYCDARKEEGQKSTRDARRKEGKEDDNLCLTLQHQEGGAVSNAVAELARAKLSNNNYYYYCDY